MRGYRLITLTAVFAIGAALVAAGGLRIGANDVSTLGIFDMLVSGVWLLIELTVSYGKD